MPRPLRHKRNISAAQAMVEFGLALPILLLVMYGLIETGRLVFLYASVVSAARQAVRYGSATGDNASGTPYYNDCSGIRAAAKSLGFIQPFSDSDIQISYDNGPGAANPWTQAACPITSTDHPVNGDRIWVSVSTQYSPIVPLVPFRPFTITSSGWRTLLVGISVAVDSPAIVLTPGSGDISLIKDAWCQTCTPPGIYYQWAGQPVGYIYTIYNNGSDPVNISGVTDSLGMAVDCPLSQNPMAPGTSMQCTGTYIISPNDVTNGSVINLATATGNDAITTAGVVAQATKTINLSPLPQLQLAKDGDLPTYVQRGQIITYTYKLTNVGNTTLYPPYTVTDNNTDTTPTCPTTPASLSPGSWTSTGITPGDYVTCTGQHTLTNNDINATYVDNTATATAKTSTNFTVTSNPATFHALVPELLLALKATTTIPCTTTPSAYCVNALGETITYTYTLTNRTASTMSGLKINDGNGAALSSCPTSLNAGQSASCTGTWSGYSQSQFDSGIIADQATATGQGGVNSNTATASVGVNATILLTISKTATPTTATTLGATISYTYKLTNGGNVTLKSPYTVTDNKISNVSCSGAASSIAPGASTNCTASYILTQADLDNGSIVNSATATATYNPSTGPQIIQSNNTATATVITYAGPRLGLIKTASPTIFSGAGQTITYTYTLKNTGGVNLTGPFTLSDDKLGSSLGCTLSSSTILTPAATAICNQVTYLTTTGDTPSIINNATATAAATTGPAPAPATASATVSMFLCSAANLPYSPSPIGTGSDVIWTLNNNTALPIHISSMTISWSTGISVPSLKQVLLDGTTIWTGLSPSSGGFIVPLPPTGPWPVPVGPNYIELRFTASASGIRIVLSFQESSCPVLNSSNPSG